MDKEDIKSDAKEVIDRGRLLESLLNSKGWEVFHELWQEKIDKLTDISNLQNEVDLQAAKKIKDFFKELTREIDSMINDALDAAELVENIK